MVIIQTKVSSFINRETINWLISSSLKGISQVILIENAVTGFIIFIAIMVSSLPMGIIALLSSITGTLIGKLGGADVKSVNQGLYGYNSVLTGMALSLFLIGDNRWIIALAGAGVAAIFTAAMIHIMRQIGLPVLTFPFIILTWFLLLTAYRLVSFKINPELAPQSLTNWKLDIKGETNWFDGAVNGVGQIFFLDNNWSGVLLLISIFWAGWRWGLYAIIGNVAALLTSYALGGEHSMIFMGLYGYNAILTIIAVGIVFNEDHRYALLYGVIAACLTVPITASVVTWLLPYGLPTLTLPFVFSTWLLLAAMKSFASI